MSKADLREDMLRQLDLAIQRYGRDQVAASVFVAAGLAAVDRIAGSQSTYAEQGRSILDAYKGFHTSAADSILGIVKALRHDVEEGFLVSVREIIHGELFGDFLEMAQHLQNEGYKDAAAVIGGGVLEAHLRQLCDKIGVETEFKNGRGEIESKKADRLNADLKKAEAYGGLEQKAIIAWLDLRNKAAHGRYSEYTKEEVGLFLSWLTDFLARRSA